ATQVMHGNVTIRNTTGIGLNPNVLGKPTGRFFAAEDFDNVDIEKNDLQDTRGIHLLQYVGNHSATQTIKVLDNKAENIDGGTSDGNGGYLAYNVRKRKTDGLIEQGFTYAQFVQLDKVQSLAGIEIAGNFIVNQAGRGRVEDNISVYKSSGTATSPILIHDNYVQGAYTIKPSQTNNSDVT